MAGIVVKPRSRIFHGHEWVYASDIQKVFGDPKLGEVISLKDGRDRMLGSAIYNNHSQIVARRFSRSRQNLDLDLFLRRFAQADEFRKRRGIDPKACRLFWSESDGLPGVVVDRYGDHLVLQTLTYGMDERKQLIVEALKETFAPASIVERNDSMIRKSEGMELQTGMLHGDAPDPFQISIGGLQFTVDLVHGQKTGFYLDQVSNYLAVASFANGRRVLDCFSNQGAFALACAKAAAASVEAVDISEECVAQIGNNAALNDVKVEVRKANVFDDLNALAKRNATYDLIILDPPSFTKSRGQLKDALRGYKEIHLRALQLLAPDGLLATFCCSHHVNTEMFKGIINEAAVDAKKTLRQLAAYSQGLDHPIISTMPETEYLKGFMFELAPGR